MLFTREEEFETWLRGSPDEAFALAREYPAVHLISWIGERERELHAMSALREPAMLGADREDDRHAIVHLRCEVVAQKEIRCRCRSRRGADRPTFFPKYLVGYVVVAVLVFFRTRWSVWSYP